MKIKYLISFLSLLISQSAFSAENEKNSDFNNLVLLRVSSINSLDQMVSYSGMGVVVGRDYKGCYIVTAYHVVPEDHGEVSYRYWNFNTVHRDVVLVGFDKLKDISLLRVPRSNSACINLDINYSTRGVKLGDSVRLFGWPRVSYDDNHSLLYKAVITGNVAVYINNYKSRGYGVYAITPSVMRGFSGGGAFVIDPKEHTAKLAGMTIETLETQDKLNYQYSFSVIVPIREVMQTVYQLIEKERIKNRSVPDYFLYKDDCLTLDFLSSNY